MRKRRIASRALFLFKGFAVKDEVLLRCAKLMDRLQKLIRFVRYKLLGKLPWKEDVDMQLMDVKETLVSLYKLASKESKLTQLFGTRRNGSSKRNRMTFMTNLNKEPDSPGKEMALRLALFMRRLCQVL